MAERLPGLTDPNAPVQPVAAAGQTGTGPNGASSTALPPAPKLLPILHPDRFSPGVADGGDSGADSEPPAQPAPTPKRVPPAAGASHPAAAPTAKQPGQTPASGRNQ